MPWTEVIIKDIADVFRSLKSSLSQGKTFTIVAHPDYPSKKTTLWKIAERSGFRLTNKPIQNPDVVIYFEDITHGSSDHLKLLYGSRRIINASLTDISKVHVDEVHRAVFGYNTFIDPTTYVGKAVMKSDTNALHDGKIIDCPTQLVPGSVYQVVIDNIADDSYVMDLRAVVIGKKLAHTYKKFKRHEVRFTNDVTYSELHNSADLFSPEEIEQILLFCARMGLDFGELDILRNKQDGKIYIIDVNKTPYGPPFGLSTQSAQQAISNIAEAFKENFLK